MSTDNENQSLIEMYFDSCSESKMAANMTAKMCLFTVRIRICGRGKCYVTN